MQDDPTSLLPKKLARARPLFDPDIVQRAVKASFLKLNPVTLSKNPVMFVVEVGALLTTVFVVRDVFAGAAGLKFGIQIGAVRQLRRSDGGSARQSAGRQSA
jgi:high-affinity K+ transport system ATPase subunit B